MHLLVFSLRRFQSQSGVELGVPLLSKKSTFVEAKYGTVLNKHKPIVETSWRPFVHRTRSPTYSETRNCILHSILILVLMVVFSQPNACLEVANWLCKAESAIIDAEKFRHLDSRFQPSLVQKRMFRVVL